MERSEELKLVTQVAVFQNRRAFDALVKEFQSPVRRFFLSQTLNDQPLSDDLAQDTFIKAYTHIGQFQGKSSFLTWLFRIAYNVFYDYQRRHKETLDIESPTLQKHQANTVNSGLKMDLYEALNVLSSQERVCITLQLMEGQPIEKISEITGTPVNTVKSQLARGKKKMADYLRANGYR
jgi:RNA polymerase sigma-70 factor (ECF subfamily)